MEQAPPRGFPARSPPGAPPRAVGPAGRTGVRSPFENHMRPELFRIPGLGLPVYGYGAMIVIGFLLATHFAAREARRRGLPEYVHNLGMVMLAAGILGGRIFYFAENYSTEFQGEPWSFFEIWKGGLVFYGGAIGGFLGGLLYLIAKRLPLGPCLDAVAAYVPIGMAFGRLGCFLNGCCYGAVCSSSFPLGLTFPKENKPGAFSPAFEEQLRQGLIVEGDAAPLPVYPAQLYEAAYDSSGTCAGPPLGAGGSRYSLFCTGLGGSSSSSCGPTTRGRSPGSRSRRTSRSSFSGSFCPSSSRPGFLTQKRQRGPFEKISKILLKGFSVLL
jgi:prolipoprotein diacylglyceryl transferase